MSDKGGRVKLRDLAKIMGNFSWAIPSVPFAQGHFKKFKNFFFFSHFKQGLFFGKDLEKKTNSDFV
jgi:hypothetical protein